MVKLPNREETCFESVDTAFLTTTMSNSLGSAKQPPELSKSSRFTLFPKLPVELRLKIWSFVPRPPTVVKFAYKLPEVKRTFAEKFIDRWRRKAKPEGQLCVSGPAHPLFHVCSESREIISKHYTPAFSSLIGHPIWFDYSTSILSLYNIVPWWFQGTPDEAVATALGPVQNIIVEDTELTSTIRYISDRLTTFWDPKVLCLVVPERLAPEFRTMWMSLIKMIWDKHCLDMATSGRRVMKRSLLVLFGTHKDGINLPQDQRTVDLLAR
jgi:hypothetical protein